ncbi:MAG: DUF4838 domain-containing protein, partial [Candidatus Hinthialibacter sp.]
SLTSGNIFIGESAAMKKSAAGFSIDDVGEEGLRIRIAKNQLIIAGGRPRGTLYGVYEFFERYLGVRFLTYDHTYIPTQRSWKIPCEEFVYRPKFSFRWSYYKENSDHPEFAARLRVNTTTHDEKLGGVTRQSLISHSLHRQIPVEKYGKEHPEYFALVDGERKLEMWGGGPEPCVTNPEVIEIVAQNVIRELDQHPGMKNISVSQNDNDKYCRCERCEAMNQREGTPMGSHLAFVNAVAERVEQKHPGVKIGTLAYWYTRKPPKTIKPRANVQIQLCSIECCTLHPIDDPDCAKNREFCRDMEEWGKICDDIWVWNYNTNFRFYDLPFPNLRSISKNVQYFLKNNTHGLFMQANGNGGTGELCDLRNYVISRCMWWPELDSWDTAKEFCRLHYGKAGDTMIQYLDFLHRNAEQSGWHPTCFPQPYEVGLNAESAGKIFRYFQQALKRAENEAVRERVEKASICAYRTVLETSGRFEIKDKQLRVVFPEKYGDVVARYKELTQAYNQTRAEEWQPIDHYYQILKRCTEEGVPVEQLENDFWKLTVAPEENGKVVELIYKPERRSLLTPPEYLSVRTLFERVSIDERGLQGYDHNTPKAFTATNDDDALRLTKKLSDGSTIERTIKFEGSETGEELSVIAFRTVLTHRGTEAKTYQFQVHPEFYTEIATRDSDVLSVYVKNEEWKKINEDREASRLSYDGLSKPARQGGVAFYNRRSGYGIMESFDPSAFLPPKIEWNSDYPLVNLALQTTAVELLPGESLSFGYNLRYLKKAPRESFP